MAPSYSNSILCNFPISFYLLPNKEVSMKKEMFKCILSIITLILGIVLTFSSLLGIYKSSFTMTTYLLLGTLLILMSIIAYTIHLSRFKLIHSLKTRKTTILAHWFYSPKCFPVLEKSLKENRQTHLSIIFLLCLLGILLASGIALTYPLAGLLPSFFLSIGIICICAISALLVYFYYEKKLSSNVETIIGDHVIYFSDKLYLLTYSTYLLVDLQLVETPAPYLQLLYGFPGTSYEPMHIVNIPVPLNQIEVAQHIRIHYLELIK